MRNNDNSYDHDSEKPVRNRNYTGEMLFDDDDNYDDDADDYSYDKSSEADVYSDSAFAPGALDEPEAESSDAENEEADDSNYPDDGYADDIDGQNMNDKARKKKNKVWGIILAIEIVAVIVIGILFAKAYINNTYNKMQYN